MKQPLFSVPWLLAITFAAIMLWDASGLDLAMALPLGGVHGFPLRNAWPLTTLLHAGGLAASWAVAGWLCIGIRWPSGPLRRLDVGQRIQLVLTPMLVVSAVSAFKMFSTTSCPWHLSAFGGTAQWVSHWALSSGDGGPGRCFPAGHAAAGFAFIGGYFVFRERDRSLARAWLGAALLAGLVLGGAQQLRGAHFMSHTLWTAWICASGAWLVDLIAAFLREPARAPEAVGLRLESPSLIE
jgi:membrane-associated PAP2 superfamily phosphatase